MKDNTELMDRAADVGAAVSTVSVAGHVYSNILNDAALIVAIISGSLAAAWHIYKFYNAFKERGRRRNESNKD